MFVAAEDFDPPRRPGPRSSRRGAPADGYTRARPSGHAHAAIRSRVRVSWHPLPRPSRRVVPGGVVTIYFPEVVEPEIPALPRIVSEDDALLVVDKPAGLLVHPTHSCLKNNLIHLLRAGKPGMRLSLAHRLDRDTSGLILLSKTVVAGRALARLFEKREIE